MDRACESRPMQVVRVGVRSMTGDHAKIHNAYEVILAARRKWSNTLMEAEEVEELFLETLRNVEYALFPEIHEEMET